MAPNRTATRYNKKGYKKKTLRKGNIFKNKSATSQAKQIYALNKKINYIEKKTKPEIKTRTTALCDRLFTTDGNLGSYGAKEWHYSVYCYQQRLFPAEYGNYQLKGNMLRPQTLTIFGCFENKNHNAEVGGKIYNVPLTGYIRIIVCKLTGGNQGSYPDQITRSYGNTLDPNEPDIGLITGPLIPNITSGLKIIKNKVIKIDNMRETRMFKIKIRNPGVFRQPPTAVPSQIKTCKNEYLIYIQYYCPVQFFEDGYVGQQPVAPIQRLTSGIKFAFIDED